LAIQQFQQLYTLRVDSQHKIHMILKAKLITKENSKEFSNVFLDDSIKFARHIKLGGIWPM